MDIEKELSLSFYKDIAAIDTQHNVTLVQHTETGKVYVKKTLRHYERSVFQAIKDGHYSGIPVIKELIETDDTLIVIEDYINGHNLDEKIGVGLFSEEQAVETISTLCDILWPLHSHQPAIIHRDIKGTNVIIDNEGKIYLIDFDASRTVDCGKTRDTDLLGTKEYAAPEQYGFGQSDQRTDIYSLGVLMNRLLTGRFPHEEQYGGNLAAVIEKAISIDPANRYQTVLQFKTALKDAALKPLGNAVNESDVIFEIVSDPPLKRALSRLPYPIRELPGFRSGKPLSFAIALLWYLLIISIFVFGAEANPELTPAENRFYDIATSILLLLPTLYLGNYLHTRDRLPWKRSQSALMEIVRISVGVIICVVTVIIIATIGAIIFGL